MFSISERIAWKLSVCAAKLSEGKNGGRQRTESRDGTQTLNLYSVNDERRFLTLPQHTHQIQEDLGLMILELSHVEFAVPWPTSRIAVWTTTDTGWPYRTGS